MSSQSQWSEAQAAELLGHLFRDAIAAADPAICVPPHIPDVRRLLVLGAGKAAAAMARAVEGSFAGELSGLVVTRYGHAVPTERIKVVEASHPVPDEAGLAAAWRIKALASEAGPDDTVLVLMSGGASSLLSLPEPPVSFAEKQRVNAALLASGATIGELNVVRRHLSAIKGGKLAQAIHRARLLTLAISDVPGDTPAVIGSGPTVPDTSTCADALAIVDRFSIPISPETRHALLSGGLETPGPADTCFVRAETRIIASPLQSLQRAAERVRNLGLQPLILSDRLEGEAREVGRVHAEIARSIRLRGLPISAPAVILSGGETTVTVRRKGRGGRNTEFLLGFALQLSGEPGIFALAGDTDGIDGSEDNAGAVATPSTLTRAAAYGLDPRALLDRNDAYSLFAALGDLVVTGPTLTNVNDFRAILVTAAG